MYDQHWHDQAQWRFSQLHERLQLWPEAVKRVKRTLHDSSKAAELMEISVVQISRHLDRANTPAFAPNIPSLLSLHFSQELNRLARRLGKVLLIGDQVSIEHCAVSEVWAEKIDRHLDFKKIIGYLKPTSRTIVAMRREEHNWNQIGESPASLRKAFWKDLRDMVSRINSFALEKMARAGPVAAGRNSGRAIWRKLPRHR